MSRSPSQLIQRMNAGLRMGHERLRRSEHIYMVLIAVAIGLLGGLCAVGFRLLIRYLNDVAWHQGQPTLEYLHSLPPWWKILTPAAGGVIVGFITHRFAREARGHGVPEVMEAVALHGGRIRPRVVIAKMFASAVCISSGGSAVAEIPVPLSFMGRSIRDLHIRQIFGVRILRILMIRQPAAGGGRIDASPEADYVFREGDSMLVMGPNERLRAVRYGVAPRKAD